MSGGTAFTVPIRSEQDERAAVRQLETLGRQVEVLPRLSVGDNPSLKVSVFLCQAVSTFKILEHGNFLNYLWRIRMPSNR